MASLLPVPSHGLRRLVPGFGVGPDMRSMRGLNLQTTTRPDHVAKIVHGVGEKLNREFTCCRRSSMGRRPAIALGKFAAYVCAKLSSGRVCALLLAPQVFVAKVSPPASRDWLGPKHGVPRCPASSPATTGGCHRWRRNAEKSPAHGGVQGKRSLGAVQAAGCEATPGARAAVVGRSAREVVARRLREALCGTPCTPPLLGGSSAMLTMPTCAVLGPCFR